MRKYLIFILIFLVPFFASAQTFERDLRFGLQGNSDVTKLQEFLADRGLYSGPITGNFFSLTLKAVKKFQTQENIKPASGYVGAKTREKLNQLFALELEDSDKQAKVEAVSPVSVAPKQNQTSVDFTASIMEQIKLLQQQILALQQKQSNQPVVPQTTTVIQKQQNTVIPIPQPDAKIQIKATESQITSSNNQSPSNITINTALPSITQLIPTIVSIQPPATPVPLSVILPLPTQTLAPIYIPTSSADTSPPVISDVQVKNITINSATVSWKMDEQSDAKLEYSTDSSLGQPQIINQVNFAVTRSVELTGLQVGTNYYFRITVRDHSGNETKTDIKVFTTVTVGMLSVSLGTQNPADQSVFGGSKDIKVLEFKLQASSEEDMEITMLAIEVAKVDNGSQCSFLSNVIAKTEGNTLTSFYLPDIGAATSPLTHPLIITAGSSRVITIFADIENSGTQCTKNFKFGLHYNYQGTPWDNTYSGKYNIGAKGKNSNQQIYINTTVPLYGNVVTITQ